MTTEKPIRNLDAARRGRRLRLCRKIAGLTLKRLADDAGCDKSYISLLEKGDRDIRHLKADLRDRIAAALRLESDELRDLVCIGVDLPWDPEVEVVAPAPAAVGGQP